MLLSQVHENLYVFIHSWLLEDLRMFCVIYIKHKCFWLLVCLQHYYYLFCIYFIFIFFSLIDLYL